MPASFTADVKAFRALGAAVKDADKDLRRELFKAVSDAAKPVRQEIPASARRTLPGGLGEWVAGARISIRQAYSGRNPGVTIKAIKAKTVAARVKTEFAGVVGPLRKGQTRTKTVQRRKAGTFGKYSDLPAIDRGRVMHPYYGRARKDGRLFGPQLVRRGFFTDVMTGLVGRRAEKNILAALDRVAAKVAERLDRAA